MNLSRALASNALAPTSPVQRAEPVPAAPARPAAPRAEAPAVELDRLLSRLAETLPDREALIDARRGALAFGALESAVSVLAQRLRTGGVGPGAAAALMLGHGAEAVVALLGCLRAGVRPVLMPATFGRADAEAELSQLGVRALIAEGEAGTVEAMRIAAGVFTVRAVFAFGAGEVDGVMALDDIFSTTPEASFERVADPGLATFDAGTLGPVAVVRSQPTLIAAGLAVMLETGIGRTDIVATPLAPRSLAALATGLVPWLLAGARLVTGTPSTAEALVALASRATVMVLPGPIASAFATSPARPPTVATLLAVWTAPERAQGAPVIDEPLLSVVDVLAFGETALVAGRRGDDGRVTGLPVGAVTAPRGAEGGAHVLTTSRTGNGTLAVAGPMVPLRAGGAERSLFRPEPADGSVDTGHACRIDKATGLLVVEGPRPGVVAVGGIRLSRARLDADLKAAGIEARVAELPDPLLGTRLAAAAPDKAAARAALEEAGAAAPLIAAFRDRGARRA